MYFRTQITIFALICALSVSPTSASQQASASSSSSFSSSLQSQLAAIDANQLIENEVIPLPQETAQKWLTEKTTEYLEITNQDEMTIRDAGKKVACSLHKWSLTQQAIESCNDSDERNRLQTQLNDLAGQYQTHLNDEQKALASVCVNNMVPSSVYYYAANRRLAFSCQASLLHVQNKGLSQELQRTVSQSEQEKSQLQQATLQLQQEKALLQAQCREQESSIQALQARGKNPLVCYD